MDERPDNLVGCLADDSLLDAGEDQLPADIARPEPPAPSRARSRLVALGIALTLTTLLGGIGLLVAGVVALIGGSAAVGIGALAVGALLVATHWGWVHVAEVSANGLEQRAHRACSTRRERWLAAVEPYARYEVSTAVTSDGSIEIVRSAYRPVGCGNHRFRFERTVEQRERHRADEPAAAVTERAEQLRRQAALATDRERRGYEELRATQRAAALAGTDEQQLLAAQRAASEALSERLNANLRQPPLEG